MKPWHACYALPDADPHVVKARMFQAQLTCVSACEWWKLPVGKPRATTHLLVPRDRGTVSSDPRLDHDVMLHRSTAHTADALLSDPLVALDVAGQCVRPLRHLMMVDAALTRGMIEPRQLDDFSASHPARCAFLREYSLVGAESPLETLARFHMVRAGLNVQPQYMVLGVGRVDLLVEGCVAVELDGREFHLTPKSFEEDRRRDRVLALEGIPVLRFTYVDLMTDPAAVVDQVRALVTKIKRPATTL